MGFRTVLIILLAGLLIMLAACGSADKNDSDKSAGSPNTDDPAEAARIFFEAAAGQDREKTLELACDEAQDQAESFLQAYAATAVDLSGVTYETVTQQDDTAEVRQGGVVKTGDQEIPTQSTIHMQYDNGWKYCGMTASGEINTGQ